MRRVVAVVGPTAAGKSGLGVDIALALGGQVVNADSMQLYRGLDIGTAKLTPAQRGGVRHHMLDVWDLTQPSNVAAYQSQAREVVDALLCEQITPVLVGGSGLYVRAVLDRLDFPGTDPVVRARLEGELAELGPHWLHARLAATDPAAAATILPKNGRRIVRALEVIELTGRPFAAVMPPHESIYDVVQIGVDPDPDELDRRIDLRVDQMFDQGLVGEVGSLIERGLRMGPTASRALGYAQVLQMLDGHVTAEQARDLTAQATRRLARRQRSWFYADPRVHWLPTPDAASALRLLGSSGRPGAG